MSKNKRDFLIKFWGEVEVKAYTEDEARYKVEMMPTIKAHRKVTTNDIWSVVAKGFIMNLAGIIQLGVCLILVTSFISLLNIINEIDVESIRIVALLVVLIFILATIRFPKTVSRYYESRGC